MHDFSAVLNQHEQSKWRPDSTAHVPQSPQFNCVTDFLSSVLEHQRMKSMITGASVALKSSQIVTPELDY